MLPSNLGILFVFVLMMGISACASIPVIPDSTTSTATLATATQTATPQPPTLTPIPTVLVPLLPDDERILASIDVGGAPWNMTVGDGFLWVIAVDTIVRIDPQTDQVIGEPIRIELPERASLEAIVVGEKSLWVSIVGWGNASAPSDIDSIVRIDPETGEPLATIKVQRGPVSLAYTPGFVWAVNWGANLLSKIDTKANRFASEPFRIGDAPYSITVGDGSVWVVNHDDGAVTRLDPETNQIIAEIVSHWEPHRVAFGESAVWVGNWHDLSVSRIDLQTNKFVGGPIPIGYVAGNIAAGDGNVWVTSDYRGVTAFPEPIPDHTVLIRIDPNTNKVVDTIPLGGHPVDVEVTEDAVWVSIQNPNYVLKIRP